MTREEAKKDCSTCKLIGTYSCHMVCGGSKSLYKPKQKIEPCDDAISREAVVQTIEDAKNAGELTFARTIKRIMELPSVTQKPGEWIPVSERLPENSGNYLITYCLQNKIETQEAVYLKNEEEYKWYDITDIEVTLAVIAWMPLPKPYEPQERSGKE